MEAIKILTGHPEAVDRRLYYFDAWQNRHLFLDVQKAYDTGECPCCRGRRFDYLSGRLAGGTTVAVRPKCRADRAGRARARRFRGDGGQAQGGRAEDVRFNAFMLKARVGELDVTVFPDARAIIAGTKEAEVARTLYARSIGA